MQNNSDQPAPLEVGTFFEAYGQTYLCIYDNPNYNYVLGHKAKKDPTTGTYTVVKPYQSPTNIPRTALNRPVPFPIGTQVYLVRDTTLITDCIVTDIEWEEREVTTPDGVREWVGYTKLFKTELEALQTVSRNCQKLIVEATHNLQALQETEKSIKERFCQLLVDP